MNVYRIKLKPQTRWRSPWHADTLTGMLYGTAANYFGEDFLTSRIISPALSGVPPFVLSDAFPEELLPIPLSVRSENWPDEARRKVKKSRWLTQLAFGKVQRGGELEATELLEDASAHTVNHIHVTLDRLSDRAEDQSLQNAEETFSATSYLSVYARIEPGFVKIASELFRSLSLTGFGADVSTGAGQFEVLSEFEPFNQLDDVNQASGAVILSTFQPSRTDPTDGVWDVFTKYGKIGPSFGLASVFKRPFIMLRPGTCFKASPPRPYYGRVIPMCEFADTETIDKLQKDGINLVHPAFGLSVPIKFKGGKL